MNGYEQQTENVVGTDFLNFCCVVTPQSHRKKKTGDELAKQTRLRKVLQIL